MPQRAMAAHQFAPADRNVNDKTLRQGDLTIARPLRSQCVRGAHQRSQVAAGGAAGGVPAGAAFLGSFDLIVTISFPNGPPAI